VTTLVKAEHMSRVAPTEGYEVMDLDDGGTFSKATSRAPSTQGVAPEDFAEDGSEEGAPSPNASA
jgi:hypothetical protein